MVVYHGILWGPIHEDTLFSFLGSKGMYKNSDDVWMFQKTGYTPQINNVLLVKIEGPVWFTIYHHRNLLLN